jgi:hypothetical protein
MSSRIEVPTPEPNGQAPAEYDFHPACLMFPEMSAEDLEQLAADIKLHGLREPIWTYNGQIIDGRNRYLACQIAEVEPESREWDGDGSLALFVYSLNFHRRHLTTGQRVAVAVELEEIVAAEIKAEQESMNGSANVEAKFGLAPRNAACEAGEKMGISHTYVKEGKRIKRESPEAFAGLKSGQLNVQQAEKKAGINGKPKPPEIPPGQCRVNGVLQPDTEDVAQMRREGHLKPGIIPDVLDDGTVDPDSIATEDEAAEERQSIQEADAPQTAEEWVESIPLYHELDGTPKKKFFDDALAWHRMQLLRKDFAKGIRDVLGQSALVRQRREVGPVIYAIQRFLKMNGPEYCVKCPPLTQGGCGGAGVTLRGKCTNCHGAGYRLAQKSQPSNELGWPRPRRGVTYEEL